MRTVKSEFIKSVKDPKHFPSDNLPEVAFAGRSNVGKSSLLNTLLGRKAIAKTSSTPGKTRLINFFVVNDRIRFVDLPGYGYARVPIKIRKGWRFMVEAYLRSREALCLVVVIVDIRRVPSEGDMELFQWLDHHGIKGCLVATKVDKLSRNRRIGQLALITEALGYKPIPFSSVTKEGKKEVWKAIQMEIEARSLGGRRF
jgi:GTP-binding protein